MGHSKHKQPSEIIRAIQKPRSVQGPAKDYFKVSFKDLDENQGSTVGEVSAAGLLVSMFSTLKGYCQRPLLEQRDRFKFEVYGSFPPKAKTDFTYPKHIPDDANWARIHVNGKFCIIGHVTDNTFNLVFLDQYHRFWILEKKHT